MSAVASVFSAFEKLLPYCPNLESFIHDDSISEICVNPDRKIFIERDGKMSNTGRFVHVGEVEDFGKRAARSLGRDISDIEPILSTRLPDGSRISLTCPPVTKGWCLSIRKFGNRRYGLYDLEGQGMFPMQVGDILRLAIKQQKNILVSGGTGVGKTTVLNALVSAFPEDERLIIIEDTSEIFCRNDNQISFEAWPGSPERPEITIRMLLKQALRFSPKRLVVGEVRDYSAYDLLQALNTGHGGSCSTVHADSALKALERISDLALSAYPNLNPTFIKQSTCSAIDFVLHVSKEASGERIVEELLVVDKKFGGEFQGKSLYRRSS